MRVQNLKAPAAPMMPEPPVSNGADVTTLHPAANGAHPADAGHASPERQNLEIALLKARVQHLELVVETARALMGSNQERLLRRLHELPRELVELSAQLRRVDPHAGF